MKYKERLEDEELDDFVKDALQRLGWEKFLEQQGGMMSKFLPVETLEMQIRAAITQHNRKDPGKVIEILNWFYDRIKQLIKDE